MNYKAGILILGLIVFGDVFAGSSTNIIELLGWVKDKNCGENFCCGHYVEPSNIVNYPAPLSPKDEPINIMATKPAIFTQHGASIIEGNVVMSQSGREITADKATFFRSEKTGKVNRTVFTGSVSFREYGKLIMAKKGEFDFVNKVYSVDQSIYRLLADTPTGLANVWGRAKHAISKVSGILTLDRATYTSCPPDAVTWYLEGKKVTIDRNEGWGSATNAFVFFKKIPVFYAPYFSFPVDKRRKSGFLTPAPSYSKDSGYGIDLPYYFNLAPNYDAVFTPEYFTRRGILLRGLFRYLTKTSEGRISLDYIPHDSVFIDFRDRASIKDLSYARALKELKASSNGRGLVSLKNNSHFGRHWQGSIDVNYVTDDYFLKDFSGIASVIDNDQLLNRADISYRDEYWNFLGRFQMFQTLHPITYSNVKDQYKKLPQLSLSGDFPGIWQWLDSRLDAEIVNFMHRDDFYSTSHKPIVSGARFNARPSISLPLRWPSGVLTPKIGLHATCYSLYDRKKADDPNTVSRLIPQFSLDGRVVFSRGIALFNNSYTQTLEPRIFYLYVPTRYQDNIPLFDTYLPPFDYSQLFRVNRFSGIDRVGDAHQVAVALTTKLLDDYGREKFNAKLGQIIVIRKHLVDIKSSNNIDPLKSETLSPLVGQLQYFVNPKFNATLNMAWDPSHQHLNTVNANLQYIRDNDRVVNLWYHYVLNGDQLLRDKQIDLSRLGFSLGWKVWRNWHIIGSLNYNTSYRRAQNYLYGLEYNSCCWAIRAVHSRNFISIGADDRRNYDSRFYIQFLFKGFGDLDFGGLHDVLTSQVRGYKDKFVAGV